MRRSIPCKGNFWDPAENFFNGLKNEGVHSVRYAPGNGVTSDRCQNMVVFCNRNRHRSTSGYLSPTMSLQNWVEREGQQEMAV
jgi:hypothetical protein